MLINNILIDMLSIGGPDERSLPPLLPSQEPQNLILIFDTEKNQIPAAFLKNIKINEKIPSHQFQQYSTIEGLGRFNEKMAQTQTPFSYIGYSTRVFQVLGIHSDIDILLGGIKSEAYDGMESTKNYEFGLELAINYAIRLYPHLSSKETKKDFDFVTRFTIRSGFINKEHSFDWFSFVVFLLCECKVNETCIYLTNFLKHPISKYVWSKLDGSQLYHLCHGVEESVFKNLDNVASSFTLSGCTPSQVHFFVKQLFLI